MTPLLPAGTAAAMARNLTPEPERELPRDPVKWVRDDLDEHLWSKQREIMRSVVENRRTAVPACHGPGKSMVAARAAAWWIEAHPIGEAIVVSTAPTGAQVKAILWRELAKAHRRGGLRGRITGLGGTADPQWFIGDELVAFGRKPQDLANLDEARQAFQGIHARYVLVILDEATGVPPWLWQAALSLLTNEAARILAIGNPDDAATTFGEVCQPGSDWNVIQISAFDTPAFTGEPVPEVVRDGLVSKTWVAEAEKDFGGKDNPLYQSKVLGQFPDTSDDKVITPAMIRQAHARDLPGSGPGAFGLDVARYGKDSSALYRSRDGVTRMVDEWKGLPITAEEGKDSTVARTLGHVRRAPNAPVVVDADGLGGGAHDGLIAAGVRSIAFTLNTAARNPRRFDSRRSEMWWSYREALSEGLVDLDPSDLKLAAQLQAPRWWQDARGRIHVESKKEMRARGVGSPDHADAAIMAELGGPMMLAEAGPLGEYTPVRRKPRQTPDSLRVEREAAGAVRSGQW